MPSNVYPQLSVKYCTSEVITAAALKFLDADVLTGNRLSGSPTLTQWLYDTTSG